MKKTYCPFFKCEKDGMTRLICESAEIEFPDPESRREFVYSLCGSLSGFEACPIYKFLENFTLYSKPLKYEVPIFYILGDNDWQTPYNIASKYFNKIDAPYKKLYVIPNAGHMTMMDEPELFFEALSDINTNSLIKK